MIKYILEIKNRILLLLITWLSMLFISYFYKETLLFLIIQPDRFINIDNNSPMFYFIFTNVIEIFSVYIQLITFLTIQVVFLYFIYHFWVFLSPAMFKIEYSFLSLLIGISVIVWVFSISISNLLLIPLTWNFFLSFQNLVSSKFMLLHFEAKLNEYLDFYILMYYLCVFYCQIFTILFFFFSYVKNKFVTIKKFRKLYYYFFVIFSTLISPPDVFSQVIVSLIIIIIYEILVFCFLTKILLIR